MSVIIVEITEDKIRFAFDTMMSYSDQAFYYDSKLIQSKNIVIGLVGEIRIFPYLKKYLEENSPPIFEDVYAVSSFLDGYRKKYSDLEHTRFGEYESLLITDSKRVFYMKPIHSTCYEVTTFEAIGSGSDQALGAYSACKDIVKSAEIACDLNIYCGKPVKTLEVKKLK